MTNHNSTAGAQMYPTHTGSILMDLALTQRNELIRDADRRHRAELAKRTRTNTKPTTRPPKRPWWWGLARSHRAA